MDALGKSNEVAGATSQEIARWGKLWQGVNSLRFTVAIQEVQKTATT